MKREDSLVEDEINSNNETNNNDEFGILDDVEEFDFEMIDNISRKELIENEYLNKYNVCINEKYHILICKTCKYVIEKEYVFAHISRYHRAIIDSKNIKQELKEEFINQLNILDPLINTNLDFITEEVIDGLNLFEGFQCKNYECNYLCRNKSTLYKHSKDNHGNLMEYEKCLIQTLFLNPEKRKYFKVLRESNNSIQEEEIRVGEGENNEIFGISRTLNISRTGHQFVSSFFTEADWPTIVDKFTREQVKELRTAEVPPGLMTAVNSVFAKGENFSRGTNHYFSELIENPFSK